METKIKQLLKNYWNLNREELLLLYKDKIKQLSSSMELLQDSTCGEYDIFKAQLANDTYLSQMSQLLSEIVAINGIWIHQQKQKGDEDDSSTNS